MSVLNDWNEQTKKNMHLMITAKCDRKCPYCCNNLYSVEDIPIVTEKEFMEAENVFLTGGEPFAYSEPNKIATELKEKYPNLKNIYVYSNAVEFFESHSYDLFNIKGINLSIKNKKDYMVFMENRAFIESVLRKNNTTENRLYCFPGFEDIIYSKELFMKFNRVWQKDFQAAPDSFFRRIQNVI